ncbi:MAG: hypothetical protein Q9217_004489, partial [Psora testacea]
MTTPQGGNGPESSPLRESHAANTSAPHRPTEGLVNTQSTTQSLASAHGEQAGAKKQRNHRAGKRKKSRRQSFLLATEDDDMGSRRSERPVDQPAAAAAAAIRPPFYRLAQSGGRNLSDTSIASEALLDHRSSHAQGPSDGESANDEIPTSDRMPLLGAAHRDGVSPSRGSGYGLFASPAKNGRRASPNRRNSAKSSVSSRRNGLGNRQPSSPVLDTIHDVNNPPSMPNSPHLGPDMGYDDIMVANSFAPRSPEERRGIGNDQLIDIDHNGGDQKYPQSSPPTPRANSGDQRRHTIALPAEEDVCFPVEGMSAIGEDDYMNQDQGANSQPGPRRRRYRQWPDLSVLEEWSREEKEQRSEGIRAKKISEPVLVGGRLRPQKYVWHRTEEDAPYRFTYFNEEFPSTIHSQTISELLQPGQSFRELFIPDPPELSDDECSSEEEDLMSHRGISTDRQELSSSSVSRAGTRHSSIIGGTKTQSAEASGDATPAQASGPGQKEKPKRYGDRPTFWLDVLSPADTEMRLISKAFGIHPLTAEDIMMQEAREKVELFPNYYFVNYRTFEQDMNSEDYLEPVNMYVVVFPEGVISFHFCMTPHPANVRRRIRQLKEYLRPTSDWISYALIDDITDVFAPLIESIEEEVDDIDDAILRLHSDKKDEGIDEKSKPSKPSEEKSEAGEGTSSGGRMLQRVGECRKKVMLLYRLLGNKADVIKGFAKRCNEKWRIAPKSDIGLYLGDIQDHILTMTSNLNHYETLLSRAHSNYLAQINIRMNERQEQTADVLGKLTVLGTIVLPMNIVTGMWGMNVLVPGQDVHNLNWFWSRKDKKRKGEMPTPSPLSIATSSVTRLLNEEGTYRKELMGQEGRVRRLEDGVGEGVSADPSGDGDGGGG